MKLRSGDNFIRARPLLGTLVEIRAGGLPEEDLSQAISKAFGAIEKVHRLMSFHDPESEVSKLNRSAYRNPLSIHPWTYRVLKIASRISDRTQGYFDCTIASLLMQWGYLPKPRRLKRTLSTAGSYKDIEFLRSHRVRFKTSLLIDLGGIAKGFAVDQAVKILKKEGVSWGSVNAGGDIRVFGKKQKIYVRHPHNPQDLINMGYLCDSAMATSALYFSRKRLDQKWVSPIVNPLNKKPWTKTMSVSVTAPTCLIADALTKAVMTSKDFGASFLPKFGAHAIMLQEKKR